MGSPDEDGGVGGVHGNAGDNCATDSGAAYVFVRKKGDERQQAYLKTSNTEADDSFGNSVGISGSTVVPNSRMEMPSE